MREFARYTTFNILAMVGIAIYILADTFFVSLALGANGLAALNFSLPIYGFIYGTGLMIGIGGATKYSILKSQKNMKKANQTFTNAVIAMIGFSVVFFVCGLFFTDTIAKIFGAKIEVFQMTRTYLKVILLFGPIFVINYVLTCFVRNDGAPKLAMAAMISGSFSNILLDYVFIFLLKMKIFGAALATGLGAVITLIILASFFLRKKNRFHIIKCKISGRIIRNIVSIGFPSLITELSFGIVMIVFNIVISKLSGNMGVAAYGIIANIALVIIAVYNGIAQGVQPLLSKYYGKNDIVSVKRILRYALTLMAMLSAFIYVSIFFFASGIVRIFNSKQIAALHDIGVTGLRIYFTACVFVGFNIVVSIYFTSIDNARPAQIISVLRGFFVIIPMVLLLSAIGGIIGVWLAFPITELIVSGIVCIMYVIKKNG